MGVATFAAPWVVGPVAPSVVAAAPAVDAVGKASAAADVGAATERSGDLDEPTWASTAGVATAAGAGVARTVIAPETSAPVDPGKAKVDDSAVDDVTVDGDGVCVAARGRLCAAVACVVDEVESVVGWEGGGPTVGVVATDRTAPDWPALDWPANDETLAEGSGLGAGRGGGALFEAAGIAT
jgi:hypothetical protein